MLILIGVKRKGCKMMKVQDQSSIWPISDFQEGQNLFAFSPSSAMRPLKKKQKRITSTERKIKHKICIMNNFICLQFLQIGKQELTKFHYKLLSKMFWNVINI